MSKPMIDKEHTMVELSLRDVTTLCVILSCVNHYNLLATCTRTTQKNGEDLMRKFGEIRKNMLTSHKPFDTM